jgi:GNAT superfamily N-acetyltransferase
MLNVRELLTDEEIAAAYPLAVQLRVHLREDEFLTTVRAQHQQTGYRLFGGFELAGAGDEWRLVVLAGVRDARTLARGPHLFVDDLVTLDSEQGKGHATAMLRWLAGYAKSRGLPRIFLDSRDSALGFYKRLDFNLLTAVPCWIDVDGLRVEGDT